MYLADLTMSSFEEMRSSVDTIVIPIGTTEAHGPHLPLGTDFMIPNQFCTYLEEQLGTKIMIAPTVNYGCSWNLSVFPGTTSVSGETLAQYIAEICDGFLKWGLSNIVFLNGHGGNVPGLNLAAQKAADKGAKVLLINWWLDYMPQILEICETRGHAGEDETSAVLAINSDLVQMEKAVANPNQLRGRIITKDIGNVAFVNALNGDATKASVEKGQAIYDVISKEIITLVEAFMQGDYLK